MTIPQFRAGGHRAEPARRPVASLAALSVLLSFVPGTLTYAEPVPGPQRAQRATSVSGRPAQPRPVPVPETPTFVAPAPRWPAAGGATVDLTATVDLDASARRPVRVAALPVSVSPTGRTPARVQVDVLDRAAAQATGHELAIRVRRADGLAGAAAVRVHVDYTAFASAYGADWSDRLRLVRLPECALRTPDAGACRGQRLATVNDGGSVAADVPLPTDAASGATLVALASDTAGGSGDYAATSLSPSATWTAGGSSGEFRWAYPVRTPPALGGPAPPIALAYSSQAVDGRTTVTNNQPSWVGEGFEYAPGYIERQYVACAEDMSGQASNTTKSGDQCWRNDNATMSLNGGGNELLYNAAERRWHGRTEDGSRIERRNDAVNGDDGDDGDKGEYWIVTTPDGTKYFFGLNRLQGWTSNKPETNSVLTVPVYGNHPNEPCRKATFASSSCAQAYRWNLDYVVDRHGNTMSLWYGRDSNSYGRNNSTTDLASYNRDGYLTRIDYGTHHRTLVGGVPTDTVFTGTPVPARVVFGTDNRCLTSCTSNGNWPDTPLDQKCTASPCNHHSPTFWSTRRLSTVTTQVWNAATSSHSNVERWTLVHTFPDNGDGTRRGLWLSRISHVGLVNGTVSVPDIHLSSTAMDNRVDTSLSNGLRPMRWQRIDKIVTETGATIDVNYRPAECTAGATPTPHTNTKRCYPVRWAPEDLGQEPGAEIVDWFHKYVVDNVVENDSTGQPNGTPLATVTRYDYQGGGAWRYADDDGLTKDNRRTWNQWRGYEVVRTTLGEPGEATFNDSRYFRGMHGDRLTPSGGTRSVQVADSKGQATLDDLDEFAGRARETIAYRATGQPVSGTIETPWRGLITASRTIDNQTVTARFVGVSDVRTWTALDGGRPDRWTHTHTDLDDLGMPVRVTEHGDTGVNGDERCTLTDYVRNTGEWLLSLPSRVRAFALTCAQATTAGRVFTVDDVITDVRTSFDHQAWGAAPRQGETTQVDELVDWRNNAPVMLTIKRMAFDDYGRMTDLWDIDNRRTETTYTPASGPVTKVTIKNPAGWLEVTEYAPAWGAETAVVDPNGRRTDQAYDALGRVTAVWLPGRSKTNPVPSLAYGYTISNTARSVVETKRLNPAGAQVSTFQFFDAHLRPRQTQAPSATGVGRIVTDTYYDTAGREYLHWGPYWDQESAASNQLHVPDDAHERIDTWRRTYFDGANRPTADVQYHRLTEKWRTTTTYGGDRTTVVPPVGGTATTTVVDALGRTTAFVQHRNRDLSGTPITTTYRYDRKGKQVAVRNTAGTEWRFGYDIRGRQTRVEDPDKGGTTTAYDYAGRVLTTTDPRNVTLAYTYDGQDRKRGLFLGATSGPKLAEWTYDGVLGTDGQSISRGMLTSSTRYVGNDAYTTATTALDPAGRASTVKVTIPVAQSGLAGTYQYDQTYKPDGSVATTRLPAIGGTTGLPAETLTVGYQATGIPTTLATTLGSSYVAATQLTEFGEVNIVTLRHNSGKIAQQGTYFEPSTRRVNRIWTTRETSPANLSDLYYKYDDAGNIIGIAETSPVAGAEQQCFTHDHVRRLVAAWSQPTGDCVPTPSTGNIGGPAPYWTSWELDDAGNRTKQIERMTPAGTRTTSYTYPAATAGQPHTVRSTSTVDGQGTRTATYEYNEIGATTKRPTANSGTQTLTWDPEGRIASGADGSGATSFIYDADGSRLIRKDPAGTTLYLPGGQQLRAGNDGTVTATRYYTHGNRTVAMRSQGTVTWLMADHQGTSQLTVDSGPTQAFALRRQDPYGNPRGAIAGTWPSTMDKGFVGGVADNTGLTHLGAREYDPLIGRFISVDPIVDFTDPQQIQGYSYASNTPVTMSDPDGLRPYDDEYFGGYGGPPPPPPSGRTPGGKRKNPYSSDAEERRSTGSAAKAHRIRQIRYKQIMEGKFGIKEWVEEVYLDSFDPNTKGWAELAKLGGEAAIVRLLVQQALDRIDESRNDGHHKSEGVPVAFNDHEFRIAFQLAFGHKGSKVESRDESLPTVGNPDDRPFDAYVDDVRSEFKYTDTNKVKTINDDYSSANKQHAVRLYLWTGDGVDEGTVKRAQAKFVSDGRGKQRSLRQVQVMGEVEAPLQDIKKDLNCTGIDFFKGC